MSTSSIQKRRNIELWRFCDPAGQILTNLHLRCELLLCDPAGAQTQNLQNRNLTLYSIELRGPERPPDETGGAASA